MALPGFTVLIQADTETGLPQDRIDHVFLKCLQLRVLTTVQSQPASTNMKMARTAAAAAVEKNVHMIALGIENEWR